MYCLHQIKRQTRGPGILNIVKLFFQNSSLGIKFIALLSRQRTKINFLDLITNSCHRSRKYKVILRKGN